MNLCSLEELLNAAFSIYLACDEMVAKDISAKMIWAASEIETTRKDRDQWKERAEALERALRGYCWCCTKSIPLGIGCSTAVSCEKMKERNVLGSTGRGGKDCPHWAFDEPRFAVTP